MAKNIVVCCKLPSGITIEHPTDPSKTVTLAGAGKELIIGSGYGQTEVDGDFWNAWKASNAKFPPFLSGAIFEAKNTEDAAAIAKERKGVKTGLEQMPQKALGVKSAAEKD